MTSAIVDTTVIVHMFRRYQPALEWYESLSDRPGVTTITWLEILGGAGSKQKQADCKAILNRFDLLYLTSADQDQAIEFMQRFRLSHGTAIGDCLIASVAYRLQLPLYTHNLKDMTPMIGELAVKPYA